MFTHYWYWFPLTHFISLTCLKIAPYGLLKSGKMQISTLKSVHVWIFRIRDKLNVMNRTTFRASKIFILSDAMTTISLHFTSLHFTSLHFTSLRFASLHFTSLHFAPLHFASLRFTLLHFARCTLLHYTLLHFTKYLVLRKIYQKLYI